MTLQPIEEESLGDAISILSRGFPARPPSFWKESIERLSAYRRATGGPPIGRLMTVEGRRVGVILTIASKHRSGERERDVVNLSSWYVEDEYRWLAPRMLARIVADDNVVFTDLSPNPQTARLNERLGFHTAAEGLRLHFLPWTAVSSRSSGRMVPFEHIPPGVIPAAELELLAHHRELGSIAAALRAGGSYYAFLFQPTRRRGLPTARLLLAPSRQLVEEHRAAIARFLLASHRVFALTFHGDSSAVSKGGGVLWNRSASVQVKGKWEPERIDHTYSELVFLRL
jgi:hypothetical protein